LKATSSFGICFTRDGTINIFTTYCNVDYVVNLDDHRLRTSFVLLMNGELIAWGSQKQPCCSSSMIEVEYIVGAMVTKEVFGCVVSWVVLVFHKKHPLMFLVIIKALSSLFIIWNFIHKPNIKTINFM
jgi:hypothetical protein